jgi:hypothetical protein
MFDREKCEYVMMGLVGEIRYNFLEREGSILMPEMSCVDMRSAIAFFKKIDPEVRTILSFNNGRPDMRYEKEGKKWISIRYRKEKPGLPYPTPSRLVPGYGVTAAAVGTS